MSQTYAINTTSKQEFNVRDELTAMGLHPWFPVFLANKYIKERRAYQWYDRPYISKLGFCVIPAIYWPDVVALKHVIGKPMELSRMDIHGGPNRVGLAQFRQAVEAEYADRERLMKNSEYKCQYQPGQALQILAGAFEGMDVTFTKVIRQSYDDYAKLRVEGDMMGRRVEMDVDPDHVKAAE